jgi:hypothetical protein
VQTKTYLSEQASAEAQAALLYLMQCEEAQDFVDFSVEQYARWWSTYYGDTHSENSLKCGSNKPLDVAAEYRTRHIPGGRMGGLG